MSAGLDFYEIKMAGVGPLAARLKLLLKTNPGLTEQNDHASSLLLAAKGRHGIRIIIFCSDVSEDRLGAFRKPQLFCQVLVKLKNLSSIVLDG